MQREARTEKGKVGEREGYIITIQMQREKEREG